MAAEAAMREVGIPALDTLLEDNQTTALNIKTGKFPKLRHVQRTHGVNIRWLYEALGRGIFRMEDCHTQRMSADIFTKHFVHGDSWKHAIRLLGFRESGRLAALRSPAVAAVNRLDSGEPEGARPVLQLPTANLILPSPRQGCKHLMHATATERSDARASPTGGFA